MGQFYSRCRYEMDRVSQKRTEQIHKVVVFGKDGVGKSSLTLRFVNGNYNSQELHDAHKDHFIWNPKLGDYIWNSHRKSIIMDDKTVTFNILDPIQYKKSALTKTTRSQLIMQKAFIRTADVFIIAFAINDIDSFFQVESIREQIMLQHEDHYPPMILVATKCDLKDGSNTALRYWSMKYKVPQQVMGLIDLFCEFVNKEEIAQIAREWMVPYTETSAQNHDNIDFLFAICRQKSRASLRNPIHHPILLQ
eukprot:240139_1